MVAQGLILQSGQFGVALGARAWRRARLGSERKDYALVDAEGSRIGTIPAPLERPKFGPGEETIFLHREF